MSESQAPLISDAADFYQVFADVSGEDLRAWRRAADFGRAAAPYVNDAWEKAEYAVHLVQKLGAADLLTDGIEVEGHQHLSHLGAALVTMELARTDASLGTAMAVQAGLVMNTIAEFGSEEQKVYWLPRLSSAEKFGAFALTEPDHGSDSVALETTAVRDGEDWVLNGQKKWIGNGSVGHMTIIWARMEDGQVGGFIVPQDTPGYMGETIEGKASLRGIPQALITLTDVRIPADAKLPGANSFRDTGAILAHTRSSVAWAALGVAIDCFERALSYAKEREQFGKPLASFQIVQQRLSDMLQDLVSMALYCRHIVALADAGTLTPQQASLAKVHNTRKARAIAAEARDMLGGVGILLENGVMRHMADLEALHTYEGTDTVQSLIVGKAITGISAYR